MKDRSEWVFQRDWEEMKKRMNELEKRVYWLEDYKKKQCEKETQNLYKTKNVN